MTMDTTSTIPTQRNREVLVLLLFQDYIEFQSSSYLQFAPNTAPTLESHEQKRKESHYKIPFIFQHIHYLSV